MEPSTAGRENQMLAQTDRPSEDGMNPGIENLITEQSSTAFQNKSANHDMIDNAS